MHHKRWIIAVGVLLILTVISFGAQASSNGVEFKLAQLPMQQQTDDPQMKKSLLDSVADAPLKWKVPSGWIEAAGSGMRIATFTAKDKSGIECSIVALKGQAGGIQGNVLRWMQQINLDVDSKTLNSFLSNVETIKTAGGLTASVIDLTKLQEDSGAGADSMMSVIVELPSETVFVKMTGSLGDVSKNKEQFRALVSSLSAQ